jgi:hypothetical protein
MPPCHSEVSLAVVMSCQLQLCAVSGNLASKSRRRYCTYTFFIPFWSVLNNSLSSVETVS